MPQFICHEKFILLVDNISSISPYIYEDDNDVIYTIRFVMVNSNIHSIKISSYDKLLAVYKDIMDSLLNGKSIKLDKEYLMKG